MNARSGRAGRAGTRLAAALLRRLRRAAERLAAPDEFAQRVEQARTRAAALRLEDLSVVISGSSRGVGLVLAGALARAGARVVINGRDAQRLEQAAAALAREGHAVTAVAADVSTPQGAQQLIARAVAAHGSLDVLVNNAAVLGAANTPLWALEPQEWDRALDTNLRAAFLCAREALRWLTARSAGGRIVNISSGAGRMAVPGLAAYVASKHGLEGLTRALALDASAAGVSVCAVQLGGMRTPLARQVTRWEDFAQLPPPETALPVLLHAVTAPAAQVHDRIFAAWRFEVDERAEIALARPLAGMPKAGFEPLVHGGRVLRRGAPGLQAFDRAEHPLGMPQAVRALLARGADAPDFARYPDEDYPRLRRALAQRLQLPETSLTFAPGSCELVERAVRCFAGTGDEVVSNQPTWFMFDRFCALAEVTPRKVPMLQRRQDGPFDHNLEQLAKAVSPRTRLVYLVNPSNPLGCGIRRSEFLEFLAAIPESVPVVVDEAYLEFSEDPETLRTHELVREGERLLLGLRTFSKFYGLAALRIGYAFGTPRAIALLERLEPLFALGGLAEEAALAALGDTEHARATHALLRTEKARLRGELARLRLASLASETHFLLVECPLGGAARAHAAFAERGLLLPRGLVAERYLMLPVLQPAQNDVHLEILAALR